MRAPVAARISLAVACVQFAAGLGANCYCPEEYAVAAAFAGLSVWLDRGIMRKIAVVFVAVSLVMTSVDTIRKIQLDRKIRERQQQREQERQAKPK